MSDHIVDYERLMVARWIAFKFGFGHTLASIDPDTDVASYGPNTLALADSLLRWFADCGYELRLAALTDGDGCS